MSLDLAFGLAMLALAGGYYTTAAAIPPSFLDDVVGPAGLPKAYSFVLAGLAAVQVVRALVTMRRQPPGAAGPARRALGDSRIAVTLGIGITYGVVLPWLGYPASIALLLVATAGYMAGGINRRVVAVAVAGGAVFWLLFVWLLGIPQPEGIWTSGP
jgi:putative tricarboxylic transport membrane protein